MTKYSVLKRVFCLFLAFVMCIGLLPVSVIAEDGLSEQPAAVYDVISRKAETDTADASPASAATTVTMPDDEKAPEDHKEIEEQPAPLASPDTTMEPGWAMVNLILLIATILGSVWLLLKKHDEKDTRQIKKLIRLIGILTAFASVVTFLVTQDLSKAMQLVDKWTALMAGYLAVFALAAYFSRDKKDPELPET